MLSAIAARKAAQAANTQHSTPAPEEPSQEPSTYQENEAIRESGTELGSHTRPKRTAKRKPKATIANDGRSKKKQRYFAERRDISKHKEFDLTVESEDGSISSSDAIDEDVNMEEGKSLIVDAPIQRAWSPSIPMRESMDEDGTQADIPVAQILTTFKPILNQNIFHLSQDELPVLNLESMRGTLLVLSTDESIRIAGVYLLTVLQGTVSLLGTKLGASPKQHHVYAPQSSPVPIIEALSSEPSISSVDRLSQLGLRDTSGTIILIQELRSGVQGLGRVCRTFSGVFDFSLHGSEDGNVDLLNVTGAYMLRNQERHYESYIFPKSWMSALENISPPSAGGIYFVKGPKKSGKSTFARTLLNRLLMQFERVAYLECDPGQSEFTPGGMVALNIIQDYCFGPPFTHPTFPNRAHHLGATTPRSSPAHYLASIQALFHTYELDVRNPLLPVDSPMENELSTRVSHTIPLVVNTMGWNKGLGANLTGRVQDIVQPTHVFEFSGAKSLEDFGYTDNSDPGYEPKSEFYAQLDPIVPSLTSPIHTQYTPADHRVINILSYLHAHFPAPSHELSELSAISLEQLTATSWRTTLPLCSQLPYAVDWRIALDRIVLVGNGAEDVISAEVGRVLNGALVGLVSSWGDDGIDSTMAAEENGNQGSNPSTQMPYVQGAPPPSPVSSTCFGLALIRSVSHCSPPAGPNPTDDTKPEEMHVLTPLPPSLLKHTRVFVKGEMELPVWGMLDYVAGGDEEGWKNGVAGVERGRVPYLQWGKGEGVGAERRRVRRNLMRKAQM
ncbi:hypothetical protein AX15_003024 [Amanita polypyramis BW_CC]|nr:hypothetical protein AX15_003024 [Amanita polypyramis BW_CC]